MHKLCAILAERGIVGDVLPEHDEHDRAGPKREPVLPAGPFATQQVPPRLEATGLAMCCACGW